MTDTILVTGSTGNVGSQVVNTTHSSCGWSETFNNAIHNSRCSSQFSRNCEMVTLIPPQWYSPVYSNMQIPGISGDGHAAATASSSLAMTSFGIPLTSSLSVGFTIGFMKGQR